MLTGKHFKTHEEKFLFYVTKGNGCWIYSGEINRNGYGVVRISSKGVTKRIYAHRFSYSYYKDISIPSNYNVNHICDVRRCVNPEHLYLGTQRDNMRDRTERNRHHNSIKEFCKNGHLFSSENTYIRKNGNRKCKQCTLDSSKRRRS